MAQLLVVEDNADILHLIWTQMRARGHQVLGASSGPEALAAVELWGSPQVAVLDVAMPSMDGLELLKQLRAATGLPELPAIFLSARVDRETVEAAHRLGAAYLAKPFMEEILYAAIEAALTNGYEGLWTASREPSTGRRTPDASGSPMSVIEWEEQRRCGCSHRAVHQRRALCDRRAPSLPLVPADAFMVTTTPSGFLLPDARAPGTRPGTVATRARSEHRMGDRS